MSFNGNQGEVEEEGAGNSFTTWRELFLHTRCFTVDSRFLSITPAIFALKRMSQEGVEDSNSPTIWIGRNGKGKRGPLKSALQQVGSQTKKKGDHELMIVKRKFHSGDEGKV